MRLLFRLFEILLLVAAVAVATVGVTFWLNQGAVIDRAERGGVLHQTFSTAPLSLAERAVMIDQFSQTWETDGVPCRTASLVWADIVGNGAPATPVSQKLATALMPGQSITSVRWQLSRIVIACQLEQRLDDTQMLRAWLSTVNFGQHVIGIDNASQAVFGKPTDQLGAEEAAKLAALVRSPGLKDHPDLWAQRAQAIVVKMAGRAQ